MNELFFKSYEKWEKSALQEFKDSEYWHDDYNDGHLEVTEDGSIYLGNLCWVKNVVTSWEDSQYYVA